MNANARTGFGIRLYGGDLTYWTALSSNTDSGPAGLPSNTHRKYITPTKVVPPIIISLISANTGVRLNMPAMNRITQNITMPLTNGRRVTATNAAKVGGTYFRKQRYHPRCAACHFFTTLFFRSFGYHRHSNRADMLIEPGLHSVARNKICHPGCSQKHIDSAAHIAGIQKAVQCCYTTAPFKFVVINASPKVK